MSENSEDKKEMLKKPTSTLGNAKKGTREEETPSQKVKRIQWELTLLNYKNDWGSMNLNHNGQPLNYPLNSEKKRYKNLHNKLKNELSKANEQIKLKNELEQHDC